MKITDHPAVAALTPADGLDFVRSPMAFEFWRSQNDVPYSRELLRYIWELSDDSFDAPSPSDPRRRDADRLRAFAQRAARLPTRQQQIANLLLDHGLSLTECARELGIARETARTHLRRLREGERRARARLAEARGLHPDEIDLTAKPSAAR